AIGYIIPYKKQIEEKFGALFANDVQGYAPAFRKCDVRKDNGCPDGDYLPVQRSWTLDDPTGMSTLDRIDPSTGFTIQLYESGYGLGGFPTTFDHEFIDTTKIFVVGNGEAPIPDSQILSDGTSDSPKMVSHGGSKEWFVITDASNGKMYAAHSTP